MQGENRFARLYRHMTADHAMGLAVARVMDDLASDDVVRACTERTLFPPARAGVLAAGG